MKILIFFFFPHHVACGISVPHPGIKPVSPALQALSLNHWNFREVSVMFTSPDSLTTFVMRILFHFKSPTKPKILDSSGKVLNNTYHQLKNIFQYVFFVIPVLGILGNYLVYHRNRSLSHCTLNRVLPLA